MHTRGTGVTNVEDEGSLSGVVIFAEEVSHLVPGDEQAAELIRTTLDRVFRPGA